ncbi:MAG: hypothetical protein ACYDIE_07930 [Candidatus Krumholzibacteriia bacterium]
MGKKKDKGRETARKSGADRPDGEAKRRPLCKWDEDKFADAALMAETVLGAGHVCRKCGRAAKDRRLLCKPLPLA